LARVGYRGAGYVGETDACQIDGVGGDC
jgi:hypothetical protein